MKEKENPETFTSFGTRVRQARRKRNWPTSRLALEANVGIRTINNIERNTLSASRDLLRRVAEILRIAPPALDDLDPPSSR